MVTASMWEKHLKEQEIKEKRRLEKEAAEKIRKGIDGTYISRRGRIQVTERMDKIFV